MLNNSVFTRVLSSCRILLAAVAPWCFGGRREVGAGTGAPCAGAAAPRCSAELMSPWRPWHHGDRAGRREGCCASRLPGCSDPWQVSLRFQAASRSARFHPASSSGNFPIRGKRTTFCGLRKAPQRRDAAASSHQARRLESRLLLLPLLPITQAVASRKSLVSGTGALKFYVLFRKLQ